jgi:hypothetical protein
MLPQFSKHQMAGNRPDDAIDVSQNPVGSCLGKPFSMITDKTISVQ